MSLPFDIDLDDAAPVVGSALPPISAKREPVVLRDYQSRATDAAIETMPYWDGTGVLPQVPSDALDWAIIGGESGKGYRKCQVEWIASIARQCKAAGVPAFVKQDCGIRPEQQGRIPDDLWSLKEVPA